MACSCVAVGFLCGSAIHGASTSSSRLHVVDLEYAEIVHVLTPPFYDLQYIHLLFFT